jgi:hypothetical protein
VRDSLANKSIAEDAAAIQIVNTTALRVVMTLVENGLFVITLDSS